MRWLWAANNLQVGTQPWRPCAGAGYGVVEGAVEAGSDPGEATVQALEAVHEAAHELGMSEEAANAALTAGILDAAEASGEEALRSVLEALPSELTDISEDKLWDGRGR